MKKRGITNIQGAIFDLDGTILDSCWVWRKVDQDFLGKRGLQVPSDYAQNIISLTFEEAAQYTIDRFSLPEETQDVMREWNQMAWKEYAEKVPLKPGTKELLEWFRDHEIPVGVATSNTSLLFEPCLKRHGIYELFHSFTEIQEVKRGKEFPDIYIKDAGKLGCSPEHCVVFEDIIPALKSASGGGFITVGVVEDTWQYRMDEFAESCDFQIHQIYEALTLLNS